MIIDEWPIFYIGYIYNKGVNDISKDITISKIIK